MVSGSALPPAGYHWVMEHVSPDLRIDSTSGGTDISGSFVGANEYAPVQVGRIGGRLAGVDCAAWDEDGKPVVDAVGDLVVTQPMPSMPVYLWNDPDAVRYTESYFDTWPGVWRHGDWVTMHSDGSVSIHGRSDSTLNRQGVRLGSSDFYDVLETMPEITETLVIGVDLPDDGYWLGLFVVPAPGHALDDALKQKIVTTLRTRLTPRHVPDEIVEAPAVPHTLSGKRLEVPIKKLLRRQAAGEGREHRLRRRSRTRCAGTRGSRRTGWPRRADRVTGERTRGAPGCDARPPAPGAAVPRSPRVLSLL